MVQWFVSWAHNPKIEVSNPDVDVLSQNDIVTVLHQARVIHGIRVLDVRFLLSRIFAQS